MTNKKVPYSRVFVGDSERIYLNEVLESGWLTTAGKTLEFEKKFAEYVGVKYACAVNSCTSALHLAVDALGVGANDKVLIPSLTFTATAEIVRYMGAHPVLLDCDPGSGLITASLLAKELERQRDIKYLIVVHYAGQAADMPAILDVAKRYGVEVIEDAAHAFPSRLNGVLIGNFSKITCFSFYANKTITTGEGGMLVTNDEAIYNRVKLMRLHGINRDVWNRFTSSKANWEYDVVAPGFKYNLPDLNAAIGLGQLEKAEKMREARQAVAAIYYKYLGENKLFTLPKLHVAMKDHAWHLFTIILSDQAALTRNEMIERLVDRGIGTSVHYKPIHRLDYYAKKYNFQVEDYPQTEHVWQGTISLPIYYGLSLEDALYVAQTINELAGL
jgi:dTDP-4-amino-4,6-dideoxygalactose transaminase